MKETTERHVTLTRESKGIYVATNKEGATLRFGPSSPETFAPTELFLAAIAGCSAIDVDYMTSRRAEPLRFEAVSFATHERSDEGNILKDLVVTFHLEFPPGEDGDKARERIGVALKTAHDKTCTVSRTIESGAKVTLREA